MGKVLYTAYNQDGKQKSGFIDVDSNKEALAKLKESGLVNISFHSEALFDFDNRDFAFLSERDIQRMVNLEVQWQKSSSFSSYFLELLKSNSITIIVGCAMVYYGYTEGSAMWMASGVILSTIFPFLGLWNYQLIHSHNNLIKAITFGEWEKVKGLSQKLRQGTKDRNVIVEADTMEAVYHAYKKDMDSAIKLLSSHRVFLESQNPGLFENKIANLYYMAGEYDKFLDKMKQALKISKQDLVRIDLAMAEAKLGSLETAEKELEKIEIESMALYTVPFVHYTKGLISYKKNDFKIAKEELLIAHNGALEYSQNPAIWSGIAMITSTLALVMYDMGEKDPANELLSEGIVKILNVHADKNLLEELQKRFDIF